MAKFNTKQTIGQRRGHVTSPIESRHEIGAHTFEGHPGYARTAKGELFLLGATNFVGEGAFYEDGSNRNARFLALAQQVAIDDIDWLIQFARWLRVGGNMRSAAVQLAAEGVKARLQGGLTGGNRQLIGAVLQRPDEPGEFLAYWQSHYGKEFPMPVKRGVADAAQRMYSERNWIKYDGGNTEWRFADVLALTHPNPKSDWQDALFGYILADRHNRAESIPEPLGMLQTRQALLDMPVTERRAALADQGRLNAGGFTWEALSGWLQGPMDAQAWQSIIPSMQVGALVRNLRNFDQAGINDEAADLVISKITDPDQVLASRMWPMQILSAYNHAPSDRWKHYLAITLDILTQKVPVLTGRTLIMVDVSTSMDDPFSKDGSLMRWDAATLFGLVLGKRNEGHADVVAFSAAEFYYGDPAGERSRRFVLRKGANVLSELARWRSDGYFMGGGTQTARALRKNYDGHDRVILLTDEQAARNVIEISATIPATIPMYTWNLAGYEHGQVRSGDANRHTFGGLSDSAFSTIPMIEGLQNGRWPWEDVSG
jgi:hypothetical protein